MSLDALTVRQFVQEVASGSATPGGGSVAGMAGALGAALCVMVARFTVGREEHRDSWSTMEDVLKEAGQLAQHLLMLVNRDAEAFDKLAAALKLPKGDASEKAARRDALQAAATEAAQIPLETLRTVVRLADIAEQAVNHGNPTCLTDAGVAAQLFGAAAEAAAYNVRINLCYLEDQALEDRLAAETAEGVQHVRTVVRGVEEAIEQVLG